MSVQKGISDEVSTILNDQLVTDETCTSMSDNELYETIYLH